MAIQERAFGLLAIAVLLSSCSRGAQTAAPAGPAAGVLPEWTMEQKVELGKSHKSAEELYNYLKDQAKGGQKLVWNAMPDWSGVYSRPLINNFTFDPAQPVGGLPTAKLTGAVLACIGSRPVAASAPSVIEPTVRPTPARASGGRPLAVSAEIRK